MNRTILFLAAITLPLELVASIPAECFAGGVPVNFQLNSAASSVQVEISATSGPITVSDSDSSPLSGTIEAVLDFDGNLNPPATAGLNFSGGRQFLDETLDMSLFVFLLLDVDVQITNLSSTLSTRVPQGQLTMINPTTYEFDAAEHVIVQDQGTLTTNGTVGSDPLSETIDFSATPVLGTADPNTIGSLVVQETSSLGTGKFYQADLTFPIDFVEILPIDGFPGTVTIGAAGSMVATANFAVPAALPGDFAGDSAVDGGDFLIWQRTFADLVSAGTSADHNLDGLVDEADLQIWEINYGEVASGANPVLGNLTPIPEPNSLIIACYALAGLLRVRRCGVPS